MLHLCILAPKKFLRSLNLPNQESSGPLAKLAGMRTKYNHVYIVEFISKGESAVHTW